MSGFKSGFGAMRETMDAAAKASSSPTRVGGYLNNYISWSDGEQKVLRFLDNDPISGQFYDWILTNDGKTKQFLIDPDKGDLVGKYASPTPGLGWRRDFISGNLEERKVTKRGIGIAVLRDEVASGDGKTEIVDHFYDLEVGGKEHRARYFGVIIQGWNNFWNQIDGFAMRYGSITDRDYLIERKGAGLDTRYHIIPLDPIEGLREIEEVQEFYGYGRPWPRRPEDDAPASERRVWEERFLYCPQTLQQWAEDFSSEERVKYWLTPSGSAAQASAPVKSSAWGSSGDEAQVAVSEDTDFASLKRRLLDNRD